MFGLGGGDQPTQEELIELRQEHQQEQSQEQLAQSMVQQAGEPGTTAAPGYWSVVGDADVARDGDDGLADFAATELSSTYALGNVKYSDWESWNWRTETEFWTMKNEFRDGDHAMGGDDTRIMYSEDRPVLTDEKARRLRNTSQVKKLMTSLSINARGLRSGTEIHAVTKREDDQPEEEENERGVIGRASRWLSR